MPIGMKQKKVYLDRKLCFDTWINCGSIGKTVRILQSQGVVNPKTGKAPTDMGVWGSAWLYVFDNMAEAKKMIAESWRANGELLTEEIWSKLVLGKAKYLLSKRQFEIFINKHSYLRPYMENK